MVCYAYVGYGINLYLLMKARELIRGKRPVPVVAESDLPSLTLVVAAYNEEAVIGEKIRNSLGLIYPPDRLELLFVTDGSTDRTPLLVRGFPQVKHLHAPARRGKVHAVHRAMELVDTDIVVFTDANALLNREALLLIARHFTDPEVGAVAGEKRVLAEAALDATAGEGIYWKYESTLKRWDAALYSVVGAAGELFSVRRSLYEQVPADTILDDFMISMRIAAQGYRIVYEPDAYAAEQSSEDIGEELKRKIRIAAGGIQSVVRLRKLLNPFAFPLLSFQYIGHRVLRWTIAPLCLPVLLVLNMAICIAGGGAVYSILLAGQLIFYLLALAGWLFERKAIRVKSFFVPYYFCVMNYAVLAGMVRYIRGSQSAAWDKARRKAS